MMSYWATLTTILLVELTDKTRLIALLLSTRYRAPVQLILGMTLGYVPAIAVAVLGADAISRLVAPHVLRWLVAASFLTFGAYLLWQHDDDDEHAGTEGWLTRLARCSPFLVGFVLVAVTEFADKSQIATAGLMARFQQGWPVFLGSLSAQALLNVLYVTLGRLIGARLPVRLITRVTAVAFLLFGLLALFL